MQTARKQQTAVTSLLFVLDKDLIFPFSWQERGMCERGFFYLYCLLEVKKEEDWEEKQAWSYSSLSATPVSTTPA